MSQNLKEILKEGTRWTRVNGPSSGYIPIGSVVEVSNISDGGKVVFSELHDSSRSHLEYFGTKEKFLEYHLPLCHFDVFVPNQGTIRKDIVALSRSLGYSCYSPEAGIISLRYNKSVGFRQQEPNSNRPFMKVDYTDILGKDYPVSQFETLKSPTPACDAFIKNGGTVISDTVRDGRINDELDKANCTIESLRKSLDREIDAINRTVKENAKLSRQLYKEKQKSSQIQRSLELEVNKRHQLGRILLECEDSLKSTSQECSNLEYRLKNQDSLIKQNHRLKQELRDADQHSHDQHRVLENTEKILKDLAGQNSVLIAEVNILREQLNRPKETIIRKLFK